MRLFTNGPKSTDCVDGTTLAEILFKDEVLLKSGSWQKLSC